ncbi:hypothetical protein EON79_03020 [bacterium]|nr:MAG: hypothetical protein EON79_03020 [bacterium]
MAVGGGRNRSGLTDRQIQHCTLFWELIGGSDVCTLDVSQAHIPDSKTAFYESTNTVVLGSDAYPGLGMDARSRMPMPSCLAHEFAHAERFLKQIARPYDMPDYLLEEAEASIHASFLVVLESGQRRVLIEDARDQLDRWLTDDKTGSGS